MKIIKKLLIKFNASIFCETPNHLILNCSAREICLKMYFLQVKIKKVRILAQLAELAELAENQETFENEPKQKRKWMRTWIRRRTENVPLYAEITDCDPEKFYANFRFSPDEFEVLLNR